MYNNISLTYLGLEIVWNPTPSPTYRAFNPSSDRSELIFSLLAYSITASESHGLVLFRICFHAARTIVRNFNLLFVVCLLIFHPIS